MSRILPVTVQSHHTLVVPIDYLHATKMALHFCNKKFHLKKYAIFSKILKFLTFNRSCPFQSVQFYDIRSRIHIKLVIHSSFTFFKRIAWFARR